MFQPLLLQHLLKKNDGMIRQSGFLARSLMAYPVSSMGGRYYQEPPQSLDILANFHKRISECLDQSLSLDLKGCHEIPTLTFTPDAKSKWISFFNEIEKGLSDPHKWLFMQDFASKSSENVARLSALLHLFAGKDGQIDTESMEQAIKIIHWHLLETKRILEPSNEATTNQDASKLLAWIKHRNLHETSPRFLQQYSPLRDKGRRNKALELLLANDFIKESLKEGKTSLLINPHTYQ